MGCLVVQPAVAWLGALWSKVVAGVQLPLDARVLLAGDRTVWDPGGGDAGRALWTHLRLLFCRAVRRLQGGDWEGVHSGCSGWADCCFFFLNLGSLHA